MGYYGHKPAAGENNSFKILDDLSSYTLTFDGTSSAVVSAANDTLNFNNHRFVQGQRVTYTNGGAANIGGLTSGSVYYIIKHDNNHIKLATSASNASSSTAINLTAVAGSGTSHTLNVAFDGTNTKFKITHSSGVKGNVTRAAQLILSVNGVIQQGHDTPIPSSGYGIDSDSTIIFETAPSVGYNFWGNIVANNFASFEISDNKIDVFTGDGTTKNFSLSKTPPNSENVLVTLDGVVQYPSDSTTTRAYIVIGNSLEFSDAPAAAVDIQARHIGFAGGSGGSSGGVTGFYGRTGNVVLKNTDNILAQSAVIGAGVTIHANGAHVTGVVTATTFSGALSGNATSATTAGTVTTAAQPNITSVGTLSSLIVSGNTSIGGVLTYEDVTNVDSVGVLTARSGIRIGAGGTVGSSTGAGIVTYFGDGSNLTGISGGVTSDAQGNTLGGTNAGDSFSGTSALKNTLFGYNSGTAITSGDQNTSFGYDALKTMATTESNTAVGFEALKVADGDLGTAVGSGALAKDTGDGYNAALGASAGSEITSGSNNCLLGYTAGNNLETGNYNIILGAWSRASATGVSKECTIGGQTSGRTITSFRIPGIGLTITAPSSAPYPASNSQLFLPGNAKFVGVVTATSFSGSGANLTGISGGVTSDAQRNTKGGTNAGDSFDGTNATDNTLLGYDAGTAITTGDKNTLVGSYAGDSLTTSANVTAIGYYAASTISTQSAWTGVTAVGSNACKTSVGVRNTVVGFDAFKNGSSGGYNCILGNEAAGSSDGSNNIVIGDSALLYGTSTASYNIALGRNAFTGHNANCVSDHSISIGYESLYNTNRTTARANVAIGSSAGKTITTGSNNIIIGDSANASSATTNNEITLGNSSTTKFRIPGSNVETNIGTNGVLKAVINSTISGHQFISQCDNNENGFEVYQQHGSTSTRNTFACYDNRGGSASKQLAFAVVGDGNVSVPNGNIVMGNTYGIDFSATGNSSGTMVNELFDDYEEGTWLPTITFGGNSNNLTYSSRSGSYVKIGSFVYCVGHCDLSNKGDSTGSAAFANLPYTVGDHLGGSSHEGSGSITWWQAMGKNLNYPTSFWVSESGTAATMYEGNGSSMYGLDEGDFNNNSQFRFVVHYRTAT